MERGAQSMNRDIRITLTRKDGYWDLAIDDGHPMSVHDVHVLKYRSDTLFPRVVVEVSDVLAEEVERILGESSAVSVGSLSENRELLNDALLSVLDGMFPAKGEP